MHTHCLLSMLFMLYMGPLVLSRNKTNAQLCLTGGSSDRRRVSPSLPSYCLLQKTGFSLHFPQWNLTGNFLSPHIHFQHSRKIFLLLNITHLTFLNLYVSFLWPESTFISKAQFESLPFSDGCFHSSSVCRRKTSGWQYERSPENTSVRQVSRWVKQLTV